MSTLVKLTLMFGPPIGVTAGWAAKTGSFGPLVASVATTAWFGMWVIAAVSAERNS